MGRLPSDEQNCGNVEKNNRTELPDLTSRHFDFRLRIHGIPVQQNRPIGC